MDTTLTLAEMQRRQIAVAPHEAVAIAQQLMHDCADNAAARPPFGPLSLDSVAIAADGSVHCTHSDATPSVPEVAIVLQQLIAHTDSRIPGGLRYAIGRALLEVEAPPFDSLTEFSQALERFERGERNAAIAALYGRAVDLALDLLVPVQASEEGDRRRRMPSATEIRRQLRDADLRLYQIQQLAQGPIRNSPSSGSRSIRGPVAACMLTGLALVVVGEVARGVPVHHAAESTQIASSRVEPEADATTAASGSDIALPASSASTPGASSSPSFSSPSATDVARTESSEHRVVVRTRHATVRPAAAVRTSAARPRRLSPSERPESKRDDERGLLRIRFEWNNPFK
jgi:hypothetical protein